MDSENTPGIFTVSTGLLSEAGGESSELDWELLGVEPFSSEVTRNWLFRGSNQIEIFITLVSGDLVELLIEISKLCGFSHNALLHEEWGLNWGIAFLVEELHAVVDECHVEESTCTLQVVASVSSDFDTSSWVITVNHSKDFVMMAAARGRVDLDIRNFSPGSFDLIEFFVVVDWNGLMNEISDLVDKSIQFF